MKFTPITRGIVAAVLAVGAISGTFAAGYNPTQISSDPRRIPDPLGNRGDISTPLVSTQDASTGSSYMLVDNRGGNWADAEKQPGRDDTQMCWAATASNMLEWTGWGFAPGRTFDSTDDMFREYQDHWADSGSWPSYALGWWFDGSIPSSGTVDVPGSGDFWPSYNFDDYFEEYWAGPDTLQHIDEYLHNGWAVGLAISPGTGPNHLITCWGFNYDPSVDKSAHPENYYKGIWVTDSDDDKYQSGAPDWLQYYSVSYHNIDNAWWMDNYYGGYHIFGVDGLKPFDDDTRPVANAGGSYVGTAGQPISFSGAASTDADRDALQYRWDFNNDRAWDTAWSLSPTASFTWCDRYSGTVVLEVSDGQLRDVHTATVTVNFPVQTLNAVWGSSASDVYAVGNGGTILHYNGTSWSAQVSGTTNDLLGVWGYRYSLIPMITVEEVYAVGSNGTVLVSRSSNGFRWTAQSGTDVGTDLRAVWGILTLVPWPTKHYSVDVYAVGLQRNVDGPWYYTILHSNGSSWSAQNPPGSQLQGRNLDEGLWGVWGSSTNDIYAVGYEHGQPEIILHSSDGTSWTSCSSSTVAWLYDVWGSSDSDVYAVGSSGTILHSTDGGNSWSRVQNSGTTQWLYGVWGRSASDIYAVGGQGTIVHYDGTSWSAMASSGTTQWLYGVWGTFARVFVVGTTGTIRLYHILLAAQCDINVDQKINYRDLAILGAHYREAPAPPYPAWDINQDGKADFRDLAMLGAHYGESY
ncbi:MAG: PKD domain-containing protein [Chloroflexi bacterium]|nr:PKD domain-containing protein [Chloroflexota bacterium]